MTNHEIFWLTLGIIVLSLLHYWGYKTIKNHPIEEHDVGAIAGVVVIDGMIIIFLMFNYLEMFNAWLDRL